MPKFNEVFEFEGEKNVKSERASSDAKVGDIARIHSDIPGSKDWGGAQRSLGTIQKVISVHDTVGVQFESATGIWRWKYFEILEPATKINPRPHSELIKQWAEDDSLEIEFREDISQPWEVTYQPAWIQGHQYRFKPKTVPAWRVLYESHGAFGLSWTHYKTEEEFYNCLLYTSPSPRDCS